MTRYWHSFCNAIFDFLWFIVLFVFGWAYETYQELNKFYVQLKENVQNIYQRSIYKELRFFHS